MHDTDRECSYSSSGQDFREALTRREAVTEQIFGHTISDPYRWLEAGDTEEVQRWTEAQNRRTERALAGEPIRDAIRRRLVELLAIGTVSTPVVRRAADGGMRYFFTRRAGTENQAVLFVRRELHGPDAVVVNPNLLSAEGTVALDWWVPSSDATLVAYGLSRNGDEESTLFVRDVASGVDLPDRIERTRMASLAWMPDSRSFYYTRYPKHGTVPSGEENYHRTVYLHRLGDDPSSDRVVFECPRMTDSPGVEVSPNGRWLIVSVHKGWTRTELFLRDLHRPDGAFQALQQGVDAIFDVTVLDDVLYVRTNDSAARYRLFAADPNHPQRDAWREILPEGEDVLQSVAVIGDELVATYLADASSRIRRFGRDDGKLREELPLPTMGSSAGVSGLWNGQEAFYDFSSFACAPTVFRYDLATGHTGVWQAVDAPMRPEDFEVRRVRARSKDGTLVPMFVVHRRGMAAGVPRPALLVGYGGFNINVLPTFARATYLLLERGGVLAVSNLRGGGEFGEQWHKGGMLACKQNVFDDAIACAEWLVQNRYTDSDRLAIMGGSNGGLLVGAVVAQRPDLVRAAVCSVPLLDMLRYHRFRIAKLWVAEYGSPDDPVQFEWLRNYSPYHHVVDGTAYPAVLLTTAESDSRVDPLHARKMTAALQRATSSGRPILLRVEPRAGHGAGKPVAKQVHELTDVYTFLFSQLGVTGEDFEANRS